MTIKNQIKLTSFLLIFSLILIIIFSSSRFYTIYKLKEYEQSCADMEYSLPLFKSVNLSFFTDEITPQGVIQTWLDDFADLDEEITPIFETKNIKKLSYKYEKRLNQKRVEWRQVKRVYIEPLKENLIILKSSEIAAKDQIWGFNLILEKYQILGDQEKEDFLNTIKKQTLELDKGLALFYNGLSALILLGDQEIKEYIFYNFILISVFIALILISVFVINIIFSKNLINKINLTNLKVEKIAQGELSHKEEIRINDEFDLILYHYAQFSGNLSFRLEALNSLLLQIGNTINEEQSHQELYQMILDLAIDNSGADGGLLFLADTATNSLNLRAKQGECPPPFPLERTALVNRQNVINYFDSHPVSEDTPLLGTILQTGEPIFIKDNEKEKTLTSNADPFEWLFIASFMAIPLKTNDSLIGLLVLDKTHQNQLFNDLDFTFTGSICSYTAQSLDNYFKSHSLAENKEVQKEIDIAATIQKGLLPAKLLNFNQGEAAIISKPARGISGDYYDSIPLDKDRILYTVCDVAGKGVPASMLMIMIRTVLHAICHKYKRANTLLTELNYHIAGRIGVDQYATMSILIINEKTRELSYSNAAHHPLYIYRAKEKAYRSFDSEGLPVGVDKGAVFGHKRIKLHKGDYLFLFTDGFPEARNKQGDELSSDKILLFIQNYIKGTPQNLADRVESYLENFTLGAKQHDDQTFLAIRVL